MSLFQNVAKYILAKLTQPFLVIRLVLRSVAFVPLTFVMLQAVGILVVLFTLDTLAKLAEHNPTTTPIIYQNTTEEQIVVDVSGAVVRPGTYQLDQASRVATAVVAAGGLDEGADKAYVSQQLQLAAKLTDGEKLYIPFTYQGSEGDDSPVMTVSASVANLVSINSAPLNVLDQLPNIGPKRAEAIVSHRPYQKVEDLLEKKVLSETLFYSLKNHLTL